MAAAAPDLDLLDRAIGLASRVPSLLWQKGGIGGGLLVYNLQQLLAIYGIGDGVLLDASSGVPISDPEHVRQLYSRIETGRP